MATLCFVFGGEGGNALSKKNPLDQSQPGYKFRESQTTKLLIADGVLYAMDVVTVGNVVKERYQIAERT